MGFFKKLILLPVLISLAGYCTPKKIRFAGGFEQGTYFLMANSLKKLPEAHIEVYATNGSQEILRDILANKADVGIVQLDVLEHLAKDKTKTTGVKLLFPLYTEEMHFIAKMNLQSKADLKGKSIWIGPPGSGMEKSASIFADLFEFDISTLKLDQSDFRLAANKLRDKSLDGMLLIAGLPVLWLRLFPESFGKTYSLVNLSEQMVKDINQKTYSYHSAVIPAGTYKWQTAKVNTLGVLSVLVSSANFSEVGIERIIKLILKNRQTLRKSHAKWNEFSTSFAMELLRKKPGLAHDKAL